MSLSACAYFLVSTSCCTGLRLGQPEVFASGSVARRQCFLPVKFKIADDTPAEYKDAIVRGFLYWNKALKRKVYIYAGEFPRDDKPHEDFLPVYTHTGRDYKWCGLARTNQLFNGCVSRHAVDLVVEDAGCCKEGRFETVVRHEAGHILGLPHSKGKKELMYPSVQPNVKHPVPASKKEVRYLHEIMHAK